MTQLLQEALKKISQLSKDQQDHIAHMLLTLVAKNVDPPRLTKDQIEQVKSSLLEAEAGKFTSEEDVNEVYHKYGA
jgi:predicted transcriptional regulator